MTSTGAPLVERNLASLTPAWLVAVLAGGLTGWSLAPVGCAPLVWIGLALLWALVSAGKRPRCLAALWGGMAVLVSHRWLLALHPLDWIGVPLPLSRPLCWLLLLACGLLGSGLLALWGGLAHGLQPKRVTTALILASAWGLAEVVLARGPLFWIGLGGSALPGDLPLAGLAALGGAGLVAAVQLGIGWSLWRLVVVWAAGSSQRWRAALIAAVLLGGAHAAGAMQLARANDALALPVPMFERVLVVQPAIPTREKFLAPARKKLERQLIKAFDRAAIEGADLVVLPEGALGLDPLLPAPAAVELLSGGFRWQRLGTARPEQRSAVLRFPPGARRASGALDKHRLVPLGEWVPLAGWLPWGGLSAVGGLTPGSPSRLLVRPQGSLAVAICYEVADGTGLVAAARQGAGWLLASANLDPYPRVLQEQFSALAGLRAIESGRWLVSVANTGPSQLIAPTGTIRQALKLGEASMDLFEVPVVTLRTPYQAVGEGPLVVLLLMTLTWRIRCRFQAAKGS
jgi:apolipoprotein N-acyltransferase